MKAIINDNSIGQPSFSPEIESRGPKEDSLSPRKISRRSEPIEKRRKWRQWLKTHSGPSILRCIMYRKRKWVRSRKQLAGSIHRLFCFSHLRKMQDSFQFDAWHNLEKLGRGTECKDALISGLLQINTLSGLSLLFNIIDFFREIGHFEHIV